MKLFLIFAIALCACAAEVKEKKQSAEPADIAQNKDKRQTEEDYLSGQLLYRVPRKQQAAPVQEPQEDDNRNSRSEGEQYRPGQVLSLNPQELLEFQQERKAPLSSTQLLQQIFSPQEQKTSPQQQFYYVEPQTARQVAYQPSHAVIARPHYSSDGGEASVGAALSVSDSGASPSISFDQELLALLGHQGRDDDLRGQGYTQQIQQTSSQNAPQYQQVDRYITKPSKKPTKLRPKVQSSPPTPALLPAGAPQQYLIETTNVQQQQQLHQQQQLQQQQSQIQYRPASQSQRPAQALRYVSIPASQAAQQVVYERPEQQGLKIVPAPKLQPQPQRQQVAYRLIPQYQQPEASPKQYRILEPQRPQVARPEQRIPLSNVERPVAYLKRYPEPEKMRAVKIYEPLVQEAPAAEQYYLRSLYRQNEHPQPQTQPQTQPQLQRIRYEPLPARPDVDPPRSADSVKAPHSAIYVSKNLAPKKPRPQPTRQEQSIKIEREQIRADQARIDQAQREQAQREQAQREQVQREQAQREQLQREHAQREQAQREQAQRHEQPPTLEQVNLEQHGHSLGDPRIQLPPPKNNKAYTPEEFAALVAAGYSVTPVPVSTLNGQSAESRSSEELELTPVAQPKRRPVFRRPQYLPLRGDDAP